MFFYPLALPTFDVASQSFHGFAGGAIPPTDFFLGNPFTSVVRRFSIATMATVSDLVDLPSHYAYLIGFDPAADGGGGAVIVYRRSPGGTEEVQHIFLSDLSVNGLGWDDLSAPAISLEDNSMTLLDGKMYWTNGNSNSFRRADYPSGDNQETLTTLARYRDNAYDPVDQKFYLAHSAQGIRRINPDGTGVETWQNVGDLLRVRVDFINRIVFTAEANTGIIKKTPILGNGDPGTTVQIFDSPASEGGFFLEIDPVGQFVYVYERSGPNRIGELDYDGNVIRQSASDQNSFRASVAVSL